MRKFYVFFLIMAAVAMVAVFAISCSDSDSGTNSTAEPGWSRADFSAYGDRLEEISPDQFQAMSPSPGEIDPDWTSGEVPLLSKVFNENEPMSLHNNINAFDSWMSDLDTMFFISDQGEIKLDSVVDVDGADVETFVRIIELTEPTTIPTDAQTVMGTSVDIDYFIDMDWPDMPEGDIMHMGATLTGATHRLMFYYKISEGTSNIYSILYLAEFVPADSTITMKGVVYNDNGDGTTDRWIYNIGSDTEDNFSYQMSWLGYIAAESVDFMGCIIGGGNAGDEFALSYRGFNPADSPTDILDQRMEDVFTAAYGEGTSLISAYSSYVDSTLFYEYNDLPSALVASPWSALDN